MKGIVAIRIGNEELAKQRSLTESTITTISKTNVLISKQGSRRIKARQNV
jgi:hypothetical protein